MKLILAVAISLLFVVGWSTASAMEVTTCIVDKQLQKNPVYYHFPTTSTKLICDLNKGADYRPTLRVLYSSGWRLIQVVDSDLVDLNSKKRISPILYLEREVAVKDR
jgi:hypothetical protein